MAATALTTAFLMHTLSRKNRLSLSKGTDPVMLACFNSLSVLAFECHTSIGRVHTQPSIAYVRRGSMTYRPWGQGLDLVPGSVLVGRPGIEYVCAHEAGVSGIGLSFRFAPELVDATGHARIPAHIDCLPPVAELAVLGELAHSVIEGKADVGLDEIGVLFAHRLAAVTRNWSEPRREPSLRHRRRVVELALWIDAHSADPIDLHAAAGLADMSLFHFLRVFTGVIGITPHQYLIQCRLRRAASLLADSVQPITDIALDVGFNDLSNFVKSFHRAAGASPRHFRESARRKRSLTRR